MTLGLMAVTNALFVINIVNTPEFGGVKTQEEAEKGIYLLKEKISHPACLKIMNDIKKKRQELVELEYKLFEKQFFIDLANHK